MHCLANQRPNQPEFTSRSLENLQEIQSCCRKIRMELGKPALIEGLEKHPGIKLATNIYIFLTINPY